MSPDIAAFIYGIAVGVILTLGTFYAWIAIRWNRYVEQMKERGEWPPK